MSKPAIEQVLRRHSSQLMRLSGVVAVGEGLYEQRPCIKVYVVEKTSAVLAKVPVELEGYTVVVEESGNIRAL